jgi:hypothetical protein
MDLAKIIGELRSELQCFDAAIAAVEELARFQNVAVSAAAHPKIAANPEPPSAEAPPVKRGRGRPRKNIAPAGEPSPALAPPATTLEDEPSIPLT